VFYLCAWRDDGHLDVSISNDDFYIHHPWKELGTMEVLLVSPLNPLQVILGKVFPYIFPWLMRP
jgi:hypothetical protein